MIEFKRAVPKTKFVEIEDEEGMTVLGVVEKLTERGEMVVRILNNDKILVFKPQFPLGNL